MCTRDRQESGLQCSSTYRWSVVFNKIILRPNILRFQLKDSGARHNWPALGEREHNTCIEDVNIVVNQFKAMR